MLVNIVPGWWYRWTIFTDISAITLYDNKVPDQHVHVHPHSSDRIFTIKEKEYVRPAHSSTSSTGSACTIFLKHTRSVWMNDRMSEQRNKQINERKDE